VQSFCEQRRGGKCSPCVKGKQRRGGKCNPFVKGELRRRITHTRYSYAGQHLEQGKLLVGVIN